MVIGVIWAAVIAVGGIIAQLIEGKPINIVRAVLFGILLGVIEFLGFSIIDKFKKAK